MFKLLRFGFCLILISFTTIVFADNGVDGFRGDKWGSKISSIHGLTEYVRKFDINGRQTGTFRVSESATKEKIGGARLKNEVHYFFDDNGYFYAVNGLTADKDGDLLLEAFTGMFGNPTRITTLQKSSDSYGSSLSEIRYVWIGKTVAVLNLKHRNLSGRLDNFATFHLIDGKTKYSKDFLKARGVIPKVK